MLINEVNEILKHQCNIKGFAFIVQNDACTLVNVSFHCSLFYKDLLQLIEQDNAKLAKSITLTLTPRYNHIDLLSTNSNTSYSDVTRQKVQTTTSFWLNENDFLPLSYVCQSVFSNFSESVTRLYQRKPDDNVKHVSVHLSPVDASSVSELVLKLVDVNQKRPRERFPNKSSRQHGFAKPFSAVNIS